jgi:hypothetical protein
MSSRLSVRYMNTRPFAVDALFVISVQARRRLCPDCQTGNDRLFLLARCSTGMDALDDDLAEC